MKRQKKIQNGIMNDLFARHEVYEPSSSFTEKVMYRVTMEKRYDPEIYRPVISRPAWIAIAIFIGILIFFSVYYGTEGTGYLDRIFSYKIDFDYKLPGLSGILQKISYFFSTASSVLFYIIAGLLAMTFIFTVEQWIQNRLVAKK